MHVGMGSQRGDLACLLLCEEALLRAAAIASSAASRAASKAVRRPDFSYPSRPWRRKTFGTT